MAQATLTGENSTTPMTRVGSGATGDSLHELRDVRERRKRRLATDDFRVREEQLQIRFVIKILFTRSQVVLLQDQLGLPADRRVDRQDLAGERIVRIRRRVSGRKRRLAP